MGASTGDSASSGSGHAGTVAFLVFFFLILAVLGFLGHRKYNAGELPFVERIVATLPRRGLPRSSSQQLIIGDEGGEDGEDVPTAPSSEPKTGSTYKNFQKDFNYQPMDDPE